jgi:hypothetical protein
MWLCIQSALWSLMSSRSGYNSDDDFIVDERKQVHCSIRKLDSVNALVWLCADSLELADLLLSRAPPLA